MAECTFRLALQAPLHVGDIGIGVEESLSYLPSDTLFSALVITWLEMGEAAVVAELPQSFADQPPLTLTSCFPYAGPIHLLPRPLLPIQPENGGKGYKRVSWVSPRIFARLIDGISIDELTSLWRTTTVDPQNSGLLQGGRVWVDLAERAEIAKALHQERRTEITLWEDEKSPHVVVDRQESCSNLYHVGAVRFTPGCGLWCAVRGEEAWVQRATAAFRLLADSGIGGRRSRGFGHFHLEEKPQLDLPLAPTGTHQVLLGRLAPTASQMSLLQAPGAGYGLITVGGWTQSLRSRPILRQKVRLLTEGSLIQQSRGVAGRLLNVKPPEPATYEHPVYRYGFSFATPVRLAAQFLHEEETYAA